MWLRKRVSEEEGEDKARAEARAFFARATHEGAGLGETLNMGGRGFHFSARETWRWLGGRQVEAEGWVGEWKVKKEAPTEDAFLSFLDETRIRGFVATPDEGALSLRSEAPPFSYLARRGKFVAGSSGGFVVDTESDGEPAARERLPGRSGAERLVALYATARRMATPEGRRRVEADAKTQRSKLPFLPITANDAVNAAVIVGTGALAIKALKQRSKAPLPSFNAARGSDADSSNPYTRKNEQSLAQADNLAKERGYGSFNEMEREKFEEAYDLLKWVEESGNAPTSDSEGVCSTSNSSRGFKVGAPSGHAHSGAQAAFAGNFIEWQRRYPRGSHARAIKALNQRSKAPLPSRCYSTCTAC